jgi:hypothetical protein
MKQNILLTHCVIYSTNSNMPFYIVPKFVNEMILRRRVVVNSDAAFVDNKLDSTSGNRASSSNRTSVISKKSHHNRLSELLSSSSSKSSLSSSSKTSSKVTMQYFPPQDPILAPISPTNPFYDNKFPVRNIHSIIAVFYQWC